MTRSHSPRPALTDMRETLIGALVLGVLAVVLALNAADKGQDEHIDGYVLSASFQRTDGITIGAPVRLAGLRVGEVIGQSLVDGFRAELTMRVNSGVEIPVDSAAVIETDGLLGPKYIEIHPGGEDDVLAPGTRFEYTQDAMVLEDLLSRIVEQARQKALERAGAVGGPAASPADGDDGDDAPPGAVPPGAAGGVPGLVPSLRDLLNNRTEDGDKALEHLPDITPNGVLPAPDPRPGQSGGQSGGQTGNRSSQNGQNGVLPPGQRPAATAASLTVPAPR